MTTGHTLQGEWPAASQVHANMAEGATAKS